MAGAHHHPRQSANTCPARSNVRTPAGELWESALLQVDPRALGLRWFEFVVMFAASRGVHAWLKPLWKYYHTRFEAEHDAVRDCLEEQQELLMRCIGASKGGPVCNVTRCMVLAEDRMVVRPLSYQRARDVELLFIEAARHVWRRDPSWANSVLLANSVAQGRIAAAKLSIWCIQMRAPLGELHAFRRVVHQEIGVENLSQDRWSQVLRGYARTVAECFPGVEFPSRSQRRRRRCGAVGRAAF